MARKIKNKSIEWIEFPEDKEIQFKIKPFTVLYLSKIPNQDAITPELAWEIFDNSLLDWKGIQTEDGKDLKCDSISKRLLAEQDLEILLFVVDRAMIYNKKDEKQLKNLQKSADGEVPKVE